MLVVGCKNWWTMICGLKKVGVIEMKRVKKLTVIEGDPGNFAITLETENGRQARGKLNFDQVVGILERYFVFKDDDDFTKYDKIWEMIDTFVENSKGMVD